ncbi:MAG: DUF4112 domain-containing protein [Acidimicrobiales bacterium]|nr:DUF4112 domain-containing protein [Hyphomonadaceae bacterium]RZV37446.1 MAG: DUF4112 domain-containing protein [Acidimicrobiales bacterium]
MKLFYQITGLSPLRLEFKPIKEDTVQNVDLDVDETHAQAIASIEKLAQLMDSQFTLPGTKIKLGLDTLIGFVPGIGDTIGLAVSGYIVSRAAHLGVRKRTLGRMSWNIFLDWLIGLIPLIGDLFDWGWKANNRNAALLRRQFERQYGVQLPPSPVDQELDTLTRKSN